MTHKKDDLLKLQSIEKEMLAEADRTCRELGIQYFSVCQITLGAIRHNGFIPYDDCTDIGVMRNDYEIFLKKASLFLEKKYSLQNFIFSKHAPQYHTKVMKNGTTFFEKSIEHVKVYFWMLCRTIICRKTAENNRRS